MAWFPEGSDYDLHWLGPVLTLVLAIALWKLGETFNVRINMDVMEHCEPTGIKDAAKNSWTNIGVVSALVLTMVVAMMQVDHIEPVGFTLTAREMTHLQHTYVALAVASMVFNLMTMMCCVMNISYIDPLTEVNAMKFFIDCPDTIGNPIVYMYLALIFFLLSLSVWVLGKYGLALGLTTFASMIFGMQFIIWQWMNRASWSPKADMAWALDTSAWNAETCHKNLLKNKENEQVIRVVQKFGKEIVAAEKIV